MTISNVLIVGDVDGRDKPAETVIGHLFRGVAKALLEGGK